MVEISDEWELISGYPVFTGSFAGETVVLKYHVQPEGLQYIPAYDSAFPGNVMELERRGEGTALRKVETMPDGDAFIVTLTYGGGAGARATVRTVYEYSVAPYNRPINQHKHYKMLWDHSLAKNKDAKDIESSFDKAENWGPKVALEKVAKAGGDWAWVGKEEKISGDMIIHKTATRPELDSFRSGTPTIKMIKKSSDLKFLQKDMQKDFTLQTPKETFGCSAIWFRSGSSLAQQEDIWVLTVSYSAIEDKDLDLYK